VYVGCKSWYNILPSDIVIPERTNKTFYGHQELFFAHDHDNSKWVSCLDHKSFINWLSDLFIPILYNALTTFPCKNSHRWYHISCIYYQMASFMIYSYFSCCHACSYNWRKSLQGGKLLLLSISQFIKKYNIGSQKLLKTLTNFLFWCSFIFGKEVNKESGFLRILSFYTVFFLLATIQSVTGKINTRVWKFTLQVSCYPKCKCFLWIYLHFTHKQLTERALFKAQIALEVIYFNSQVRRRI